METLRDTQTMELKMSTSEPSWTKNEELGLRCEILSYALHSGGRSTCPPDYLVQNESNVIVVTALSGQQIIVNNLNNDYNDSVIYKFKHIFTLINHRVRMVKDEIFICIINPCFM